VLRVTPISAQTVKNASREERQPEPNRLAAECGMEEGDRQAQHRGNRLFVKIEVLEVDRLREQRERERDDERRAEGEARRAREVEQRLDQDQAEQPERDLGQNRRVSPAELEEDARQEVHPRRERVKVIEGLEQAILQVGGIAQPHPVEAEVEAEASEIQRDTARDE
jgi:hypothetical protein